MPKLEVDEFRTKIVELSEIFKDKVTEIDVGKNNLSDSMLLSFLFQTRLSTKIEDLFTKLTVT